jgi:hypothetical protein
LVRSDWLLERSADLHAVWRLLQHGMSELDAKFQVAVDFVAARGNNKLTNEQVTWGGRGNFGELWRLTELLPSFVAYCRN